MPEQDIDNTEDHAHCRHHRPYIETAKLVHYIKKRTITHRQVHIYARVFQKFPGYIPLSQLLHSEFSNDPIGMSEVGQARIQLVIHFDGNYETAESPSMSNKPSNVTTDDQKNDDP